MARGPDTPVPCGRAPRGPAPTGDQIPGTLGAVQHTFEFRDGSSEVGALDGFEQQVIDRVDLEGVERVLVVCRGEHDQWLRRAELLQQLEAGQPGISMSRNRTSGADSRIAVSASAGAVPAPTDFDAAVLFQESGRGAGVNGDGLIVDEEDLHSAGTRSRTVMDQGLTIELQRGRIAENTAQPALQDVVLPGYASHPGSNPGPSSVTASDSPWSSRRTSIRASRCHQAGGPRHVSANSLRASAAKRAAAYDASWATWRS